MISIKNSSALAKMEQAGQTLALLFKEVRATIKPGVSTLELDQWFAQKLSERGLVSMSKGYRGYAHSSCISVNDEVVHGVPRSDKRLVAGDLVKIDVCASYQGYAADMARCFFVNDVADVRAKELVAVAQAALDSGIQKMRKGNRVSDISAAIGQEVERHKFGVVRVFAGHGIGKKMHEDPEILNYGQPGRGPVLQPGMTFAIEPMITMGHHDVYITHDGWTVKTKDRSLAAHVEDTVVVTEHEPRILTRLESHEA